MSKKQNRTEAEIDKLVVAQADDDSAWEPVIHVRKAPPDLAAHATFLAQARTIKARVELNQNNNAEDT